MSKNAYHEHLLAVPLLAGLDSDELDEVAQITTDLKVPAGRKLISEGSNAQEMVIVIDGKLEVTRDGEHVADVGPGGFAGEMALLNRSARSATVTASDDSRVLHLEGSSFDVLLQRVPMIAVKMLPVLAARLGDA